MSVCVLFFYFNGNHDIGLLVINPAPFKNSIRSVFSDCRVMALCLKSVKGSTTMSICCTENMRMYTSLHRTRGSLRAGQGVVHTARTFVMGQVCGVSLYFHFVSNVLISFIHL